MIKLSASLNLISILISSFVGSFAFAVSADDLMEVSAYTAANYNNPAIQKSFKEFIENYKNRDEFQTLKDSSEGQKAIRTAERVLNIQTLQDKLSACINGKGLQDKNIQNLLNITVEMSLKTEVELCLQQNQISRLSQDVEQINQVALQSLIANQAQLNLKKTKDFWNSVRQENQSVIATDLTEKLIDLKRKPPLSGKELLFYTRAFDSAKKSGIVESKDVKNGLDEIFGALDSQEKILSKPNLEDLVKYQPAAVAEILLTFPEAATLLCSTFELIEQKNRINNNLSNLTNLMWGGLAVGGFLLASTGVGAAPGAALTMAAVSGLTVMQSGRQGWDAYQEASMTRSNFYLANESGSDVTARVDEYTEQAYAELGNAAIGSIGFIPFRAVKNSAQQALRESRIIRSGSPGSSGESLVPLQATKDTIEEIRKYPKLRRVISSFSNKEHEELITGLAKSDPKSRSEVLKKMAETDNPDKMRIQIQKSMEELRACRQ